jgi:hypothetical protein
VEVFLTHYEPLPAADRNAVRQFFQQAREELHARLFAEGDPAHE